MRFTAFYILIPLLLLSGCISTPPSQFYTLDMTPSGRAKPDINLEIETIEVAEALQRESILIMASTTTVEYYASEQWVAGLHELIRQKLEIELGPKREGQPTLGMAVRVQSFGQVDGPEGMQAQASLGVKIRPLLSSRYEKPLFERIYTITKPVQAPSVSEVVVALSDCMEEIAVQIAGDTRKLAGTHDTTP